MTAYSSIAASNINCSHLTMGRKRSRLGLATLASTLASALAMSVSAVGAFSTTIPSPSVATISRAAASSNTLTWQQPHHSLSHCHFRTRQLNVLADPEVYLEEQLELVHPPRPLKGSKKIKRRKVPPRLSVKSSKAAKTARVSQDTLPFKDTTEITAAATTTTTTITAKTSSLPPRRREKRNPRQTSTMPGFQHGGSNTGRQKAFRDGIKLVESKTGKKMAKYVDTPDARKRRRKLNGEAMYKSSASVPDSLVQFANEIHTVDRITPKEEIELGELTQEAIRLQTLHEELEDQLQRPPTDDEWCAAAGKINLESLSQAIEDGLEAKNKLVTSNLRMVQGVVNLYIRNGLGGQYNAGDLMQEGIMVRFFSGRNLFVRLCCGFSKERTSLSHLFCLLSSYH